MGHLTAEERGAIEYGLEKGDSVADIAVELNRHPSTIYREIKRNSLAQGTNARYAAYPYRAANASNLASLRRRESKKPSKATPRVINTILKYLTIKWSPEQIAKGVPALNLTAKTIYNWIYTKVVPFDIKRLRRRGKQYKRPEKGTLLRRPDSEWYLSRSIELRPEEVNRREMIGHWEADSVLSSRTGKGAVATFVERKTRKYIAYKLADQTSHSMYQAFQQLLSDFEVVVHSVTCDRGTEFINQQYVSELENLGLTVYFAHAYSPHERGSNENHNGLLREYFPKGTDFSKISQAELTQVTDAINNRPRKVLNWQTANKQFMVELSSYTV